MNLAVIGAGIAGLSCAAKLQNEGHKVSLFEKSHVVSGRLRTRLNANWQGDHGAQYFTARDPIFAAEVKRWLDADVARVWQPRLKMYDGKRFWDKSDQTNPQNIRYVGYPRNHSPAKWLAESLSIQTETTIVEISQVNDQWRLLSKEHGYVDEYFDALVLAMPAPQAKELLAMVDTSLIQLCNTVEMLPCFALLLYLNHPLKCSFDALFINHGPLSWAARDSAKPGRVDSLFRNEITENWVLHADNDWSLKMLDVEPEEIAKVMLDSFRQILLFNSHPSLDRQLDDALICKNLHCWHYADCEEFASVVNGWDIQQRLGLCGDWLNGGKIQGAWLSGYHLATKINHLYA